MQVVEGKPNGKYSSYYITINRKIGKYFDGVSLSVKTFDALCTELQNGSMQVGDAKKFHDGEDKTTVLIRDNYAHLICAQDSKKSGCSRILPGEEKALYEAVTVANKLKHKALETFFNIKI